MRLRNISLAAFIVGGSMLLTACGGGDGGTLITTANSDVSTAVTPSTVHAVLDTEVTFPSGVSELGTTAPTTLTLSGSNRAKPLFALKSGEYSATGEMGYGSCIFTITESNFLPAASFPLLQVGQRTRINPCTVKLKTAGLKANINSALAELIFQLGGSVSMHKLTKVSISSTGEVSVNGEPVGTVSVVVTTGAGS